MNDQSPNELSLTLQRHIPAPPKAVYDAWLNPETLMRFISNCKGMAGSRAETDPRIGGRFTLVMNNGTRDVVHTGTYQDLAPHSRIQFTWESEYSTVEGSAVTLTFMPNGAGTDLTLTHVRFANEGSRDGHAGGWATILDGLLATEL